jgi:hypothetical protein
VVFGTQPQRGGKILPPADVTENPRGSLWWRGESGRMKPRGSARSLSPHYPPGGRELLPASSGGVGVPGDARPRCSARNKDPEGSWRARLPGGGSPPPAPQLLPSSPSSPRGPASMQPKLRQLRQRFPSCRARRGGSWVG